MAWLDGCDWVTAGWVIAALWLWLGDWGPDGCGWVAVAGWLGLGGCGWVGVAGRLGG